MQETTEHAANIAGIVNAARKYNPEIGNRVKHFINENFGYTVQLTGKGAIKIGRSYAQDGVHTMSEEEIQAVASTYWKH